MTPAKIALVTTCGDRLPYLQRTLPRNLAENADYPNAVHLVGYDLDGNEISVEADEFEGRIFQHEMDHLNGKLFIDRAKKLYTTEQA